VSQYAVRQQGAGEQSCWPLVEGTANAFAVRSARAMLPARGAVCGLLCVFCISVINWHRLVCLCNTVAAVFLQAKN
jgi:hypothetical protein